MKTLAKLIKKILTNKALRNTALLAALVVVLGDPGLPWNG